MAITLAVVNETPQQVALTATSDGTADIPVAFDLLGALADPKSTFGKFLGGTLGSQAAARTAFFENCTTSVFFRSMATHTSAVIVDANVAANAFRLEVSGFKVTATDVYVAVIVIHANHSLIH